MSEATSTIDATPSLPELLTIGETAQTLRVSKATVRRLIRSKELHAVTLGRGRGRALRVPVHSLERLLVDVAERDE